MSSSTISGCACIENLPDVLVMEIIARSSCYKSVARCMYACKRWFNLVISPLFVHRFLCLHRLQEPELLGLIQQFEQYKRRDVFSARTFTHWSPFSVSFRFLPCCGGKSDEKVWMLASFNHSAYYVCNPLSKQFLVLPPHPRLNRKHVCPFEFDKIHFALVCDPCYNVCDDNVVINRGYSFKLVCFCANGTDRISIDTFSSETGKWSTLAMRGSDIRRLVVFNSMVLWQNQGIPWPTLVEGFDTRDNEVRVHEFDPLPLVYDKNVIFGLCRGNLRMFTRYDCCFYVREFKDGYWSMVHKVPIWKLSCEDERSSTLLSGLTLPQGITFHPSDGDIVYFRPFNNSCTLMCNLRTRIVEVGEEDRDRTRKIVKVAGEDKQAYLQGVFPLVLPVWPTPLPILPQMYS